MNQSINIAIFDAVPSIYWADDEGRTDSQKFVELLSPVNPAAEFDIYYVSEGQFPDSIDQYQGILVTGSPASVHDDFEWIRRLSALIRQAREQQKKIIGSCFGHQLIAKTFGGEVGFNDIGWMIGNYPLNVFKQFDWMHRPVRRSAIYHFNQERVTRLPEQATSFASSEHYDDFAYVIGDNILCFQGHPEQPETSMNNFLDATVHQMDADSANRARAKINDGEPDAQRWGEWMMNFWLARN